MMKIEVPLKNLDELLRNAFDAFATSIKYEQMIIPLLKDKEYKIYLNKRHVSPRTSYLKVGIKKKHRSHWIYVGKLGNSYSLVDYGYCRDSRYDGHYLQPIATAPCQYSYMLRWKGL